MTTRDLWGEALPPAVAPTPPLSAADKRAAQGNPCLVQYGPGPAETWCRSCAHFLRVRYHDATYRKCDLRKLTHGAGSDHKASWPACGRYEAVRDESPLQVVKP